MSERIKAYINQPYTSQPYTSQPYTSQPYTSQPYTSQPCINQPCINQADATERFSKEPFIQQSGQQIVQDTKQKIKPQLKQRGKLLAAIGLVTLLRMGDCTGQGNQALGQGNQAYNGGQSARRSFGLAARTTAHTRHANPADLAEIKRLLQQATTAVNSHDSAEIQPYVTPAALATFDWVKIKTTKSWIGDLLPVVLREAAGSAKSEAPPSYLAVFHAWHTCESDGDHLHKLEKTTEGWRLGAEIPETETGGYRVRDHDLTVNVDIAKQFASMQDKARLEVTREDRTPYCLLRLSEDFHLSALTIDSTSVPFQQVGGIIVFSLPVAKPTVKTFIVGLTYAGRVAHQGSDYILSQEATLDSYWYPHIARLPATATITVTAPPGWSAIAQGEKQQERRNADSTTTVTYRNELPTSFFTVDIGRYAVTQRTVNGRVLSIYLRAVNEARAQQSLDLLQQSLAYFDANFAPFPYKHYEIVETKGPFGGALEAYSFATFGEGTLPSTVVHELSHTWWGGIVPCTYTRSMWNESFAEYSSMLFERVRRESKKATEQTEQGVATGQDNPQGEDAAGGIPGKRQEYGKTFDAYSLAEAHDTSDGPQEAVGYGKGGLVMRVLEAELGRATLLRCLQTFVKEHPKGEAAEWPEFVQAVNKTTGQDYSWFFEQWVQRRGLPRVRLENITIRRQAEGYEVQGEIVQEGEPYRLHLPMRLWNRDGKAKQGVVEIQGERTVFRLQTPFLPARLTLDPENLLPLATTTDQATITVGR